MPLNQDKMPVVNFLTSAASFLYAVSSMLGGAQNNAAVSQSFGSNFQQTPPTHFLPVGQEPWRSPKSNNDYHPRNNNFISNNQPQLNGGGGGDPSNNNFIPNSYYEHYNDHESTKGNNNNGSSVSSTI